MQGRETCEPSCIPYPTPAFFSAQSKPQPCLWASISWASSISPAACFFFFFFFGRTAWKTLVPDQEWNPCPLPAVEAQSPNHWTAREVPHLQLSCLLALLRYTSYIIQWIHLKSTIWRLLVCLQSRAAITVIHAHFHHPGKTSCNHQQPLPVPLSRVPADY